MKNLFVPYALAVKAKEHGFDEPCLQYFYEDDLRESNLKYLISQKEVEDVYGGISAPLYQQLIDWFREKHNILIQINSVADSIDDSIPTFKANGKYSALLEDCTIGKVHSASNTLALVSSGKYDYNQVLIAGLEKAFELIKK